MTKTEEFDLMVKRLDECDCPMCGSHTSRKIIMEKSATMTVYGKTLKQIAEICDFAYCHGYKDEDGK